LILRSTEDVLSGLAARRRPGQVLVGFAAEHGEGAVAYGRGKLERKRLDAVVVNDISRPGIGFDADDNEVTILTADGGERRVAQTSKRRVAEAVLDAVSELGVDRAVGRAVDRAVDRAGRESDGAAGPSSRSAAGV
jgi:phosphopantothenoylcysteine decarboxylase/phosphopantothenate--cysteine ligase